MVVNYSLSISLSSTRPLDDCEATRFQQSCPLKLLEWRAREILPSWDRVGSDERTYALQSRRPNLESYIKHNVPWHTWTNCLPPCWSSRHVLSPKSLLSGSRLIALPFLVGVTHSLLEEESEGSAPHAPEMYLYTDWVDVNTDNNSNEVLSADVGGSLVIYHLSETHKLVIELTNQESYQGKAGHSSATMPAWCRITDTVGGGWESEFVAP